MENMSLNKDQNYTQKQPDAYSGSRVPPFVIKSFAILTSSPVNRKQQNDKSRSMLNAISNASHKPFGHHQGILHVHLFKLLSSIH
jgi:hypothetical protein